MATKAREVGYDNDYELTEQDKRLYGRALERSSIFGRARMERIKQIAAVYNMTRQDAWDMMNKLIVGGIIPTYEERTELMYDMTSELLGANNLEDVKYSEKQTIVSIKTPDGEIIANLNPNTNLWETKFDDMNLLLNQIQVKHPIHQKDLNYMKKFSYSVDGRFVAQLRTAFQDKLKIIQLRVSFDTLFTT